jgi:anaerobic selenocysteine-containing dehydrogenase
VAARAGPATVTLHPEDAASRGLRAGQIARVHNATGALELTVAIAEVAPVGVALSPKGRWLKSGRERANVNVLNPGTKSDMGESAAVHGIEVTVEPM